MSMQSAQFTDDELAEIYFGLQQRVNDLIARSKESTPAPLARLIERQLTRTNAALAKAEKIISDNA